MRFLGIVPKVSFFAVPYAGLAFYLNLRLNFSFLRFPVLGSVLLTAGIVLWLLCYRQISKAYRRGELLTTGCYSKVRHPIYSIWAVS